VDGNVYRVLARYFGITTPTDGSEGKKRFQALADSVLDRADPGGFNQAIMDHGATVCTPARPDCPACPVAGGCIARAEGLISLLPVRAKKAAVQTRYFHYLLIHHKGSLWIRQRSEKDIWKGLYEPLMIEAGTQLDRAAITAHAAYRNLSIREQPEFEGSLSQRLTHRIVASVFYSVHVSKAPPMPAEGRWVSLQRLREFAFPKTLINFFEKKGYF
jgi:A/G-specific adenine glycosylase